MGVTDPQFVSSRSAPGTFVLVSCSLAVPVKRVGLICEAFERAARARPSTRWEWHHIGDGELLPAVRRMARDTLPANASASFHGQLTPPELLAFYRTHTVDAFINASRFEGTPVSLIEAASSGIPLIVTAVGGNIEVASSRNGVVVSANPSPSDLAAAIVGLADDPSELNNMGRMSREVWADRYDAGVNYPKFGDRLIRLRTSRHWSLQVGS
jgi:glycosyltransferase involved in cell wall biosynthesis